MPTPPPPLPPTPIGEPQSQGSGSLLDALASPADLRRVPIEKLPQVAGEIRERIIEQVSRVGGHLAPNLGVVELTIALHYVFDFAHDRLLFDVGHQCYPHKLLTGRQHLLSGLRTRSGMAGFPEPRESAFDLFSVGHAGTGISTAVGMARGDGLRGEAFDPRQNPAGRRVVTLIGDASIVNGVAMEGLNNAGTLQRQFLVVLNDNGMSISRPQGAVAQYFDRLRISPTYADFKKGARSILRHVPGGSFLQGAYHKAGEVTKAAMAPADSGAWFEHFGLKTVGPIDGHNINALIEFLAEARDFDRPMVLWVKTVKGKGLDVAERDSTAFHSPAAFRVERAGGGERDENGDAVLGCRVEIKSDGRSFTKAFGEAMLELMEREPRAVVCTAAMPDGTGLTAALERFPQRAWDVGICESHAMDMMAGLARTGAKPFFAVYSTFLQRAFDQAFQEVALQGLPVRLCLDRAGLVGGDGAVHHGFCDIALLRALPSACLLAAMDEPSLKAALDFMLGYEDGLSAVRYPRDNVSTALANIPCPPFAIGKARRLDTLDGDGRAPVQDGAGAGNLDGLDAAILAFGTVAVTALSALPMVCDGLARAGIAPHAQAARVAVFDARFAKPVDAELIAHLLSRRIPVVTVEDHSVIGGFGSAVIESAAAQGLDASLVGVLGLPDRWVYQNSRSEQLAEVGLDAAGIGRATIAHVLSVRERSNTPAAPPRHEGSQAEGASVPAGASAARRAKL